jgi:MYXO-CTERM domain-containing protein
MEIVAEGQYAARVELHNDAVWGGSGLKRVELQHLPVPARTAEGATTWFAWSFYLPEALPEGSVQGIGYWESNDSWQQVMALNASGQDLSFQTRRPTNVVQWEGHGVATPGEWHRVAMRVTWSTNAAAGSVSLWFDGELVVDDVGAQTRADGNPHFVQIGLLRWTGDFMDVPVIILDDAVEGDSFEDVRADELPPAGGDDGGSSDDGGEPGTSDDDGDLDDTSGSTTDGGGDLTTGDPGPVTGSGTDVEWSTGSGPLGTETGDTAEADGSDDGCSCRSQGSGSGWGRLGSLLLLGLWGLRRRRPNARR